MGLGSFFKKILNNEDQVARGRTVNSPVKSPVTDEPDGDGPDLWEPFARVYMVELLFNDMPLDLHQTQIYKALLAHFGAVDHLGEDKPATQGNRLLQFAFPGKGTVTESGAMPFIMAMMVPDRQNKLPLENEPHYAPSFTQSWLFPDAKEALENCRYSLMVNDMLASGVEYRQRLRMFMRTLYTIVDVLRPVAIHFRHSQQFIKTERFLDNHPDNEDYDLLMGAMNVRFFKSEGEDDTFVMDTLGLVALGVPDLQMHYHGFEPSQVAGVLNGTGHYIFEHGDVIQDGHTLSGWDPEQRWVCQHEASLIEPTRLVLDINPGPPFAAGNRA
ncbi:MAG: DUF4261 domain-containing protein [Bacteroidia bacterium]